MTVQIKLYVVTAPDKRFGHKDFWVNALGVESPDELFVTTSKQFCTLVWTIDEADKDVFLGRLAETTIPMYRIETKEV